MFNFSINNDRFVEYPKAYAGRYSIRCEHLVINKSEEKTSKEWIPTGYIYKLFNKENNKYSYSAKDAIGNPVFTDINELHLLKKEFRNHGENLANVMQMAQVSRLKNENPVQQKNQVERKQEIAQLRDKTKAQQREERRDKNLHTEKQLDAKQAETTATDKGNKDISEEPSSRDTTQSENDSVHDIATERMDELQEIREQGEDLSQDMEVEM